MCLPRIEVKLILMCQKDEKNTELIVYCKKRTKYFRDLFDLIGF